MQKRKFVTRTRILLMLFIILSLYMCYYLIGNSGVIKFVNADADRRVDNKREQEIINKTIEGSFIDRKGDYISVAETEGEPAQILYPEAYSPLIGYNSVVYGLSGLRAKFQDYLLDGGKDDIGATITLTTDNSLQRFCYSLLDEEGAIVVLDNKEGEILALASRSDAETEYDANTIETNMEKYNSIDKFHLNRALLAEDPPGSTFKLITTAALFANGMSDYIHDDSTGVYEGIHNAGHVAYGNNLDIETGLIVSSNTIFAAAAEKLGGSKLKTTAEKFMYNQEIELDFTTISSTIDFGYYKPFDVRQIGFGQGNIKVSPLHLTMCISAISEEGIMHKPYLIKRIEDGGRTRYKGKSKKLSKCMDKNDARELKEMLHATAINYGFDEATYGTDVIAKSGTAQLANSGDKYYHIYMLIANEDYSICISLNKATRSSGSLVTEGKAILEYLEGLEM